MTTTFRSRPAVGAGSSRVACSWSLSGRASSEPTDRRARGAGPLRAGIACLRGRALPGRRRVRPPRDRPLAAPLRDELLCLRGESLLHADQPSLALDAFETLLHESPQTPYAAQALFGRASARQATGDLAGAEADRRRLRDGSRHSVGPPALGRASVI